ncbi:RAVE protein 1 C terminal-domain-containing protein, partial [Cladochytrium replicatum]
MLHHEQTLGGKPNGCTGAFSTFVWADSHYLVYGSAHRVVIYSAEFRFVHSIDASQYGKDFSTDEEGWGLVVRAVAGCDNLGLIAAGYGNHVLVFAPRVVQSSTEDSGESTYVWEHIATIDHETPVLALCWAKFNITMNEEVAEGDEVSSNDQVDTVSERRRSQEFSVVLLVGGKILRLMVGSSHSSWNSAWSERVANEVNLALFSPDGQYFATAAKYDRWVKVWFPKRHSQNQQRRFAFTYLQHPRSVLSFKWRNSGTKSRVLGDNVLFTLCMDNVGRLWSESNDVSHQFHLSAIIDPQHVPFTASASTGESTAVPPDSKRRKQSSVSMIHWLGLSDIVKAIDQRDVEERRLAGNRSNEQRSAAAIINLKRSAKLREIVKDYPDIFFHIGKDGSMTMWGVQNLTGSPRRIPKVFVIMKIDKCVLPFDYNFFCGSVFIHHNSLDIKKSSFHFPAELYIFGQNPTDGVLNCYAMDLDEFFASEWASAHLRLVHSWCGHRKPAVRGTFCKHPSLPFVASVDEDGECLIFRISVPNIGLRSTHGLEYISTIATSVTGPGRLAWLPSCPILLIQERDSVVMFDVKSDTTSLIGALPGFDATDVLTFLHVYCDPEVDQSTSDEPFDPQESSIDLFYVVGLSPSNKNIYLWLLYFEGSKLKTSELVLKTALHVPSVPEIVHVAATDDLCAKFYPHLPLGAHMFITVTSDRVARFWHFNGGKLRDSEKIANDLDKSSWVIIEDFSMETLPDLIETDAFGKMATVTHRSMANPTPSGVESVLHIYSNEATGLEMRIESTTMFSSRVIGLDWQFSSDGQHLLAVATENSIGIYCQERSVIDTERPRWLEVSKISLALHGSLRSFSWLQDGSLAAATDDKLLIFDRWIGKSEDGSHASNIFDVATKLNGRLPDHHPKMLINLLLWGKFETVEYILSLLTKFVKLMVENGRKIHDVPIPIWKLLKEEGHSNKPSLAVADALFMSTDNETDVQWEIGAFNGEQARYLADELTKVSLPHITHVEQLQLRGLVNTTALIESQRISLDENGVRYLTGMRLQVFANRTAGSIDSMSELGSREMAWAYFSESQSALVDFCVQEFNGKLTWKEARILGMGYWLTNLEMLRRQVETMARNQYMAKNDKDPVDCSLFYIALKKKNVLLGLWRIAQSHPEQAIMVKFLANDFSEERWQKAALKNAYALLGKQRYEYAVTFFLLGDRLRDAVNVCLKHLGDVQLALLIARIYEGDEGNGYNEIIESELESCVQTSDRWKAAMFFAMKKKRVDAVHATVLPLANLVPSATTSPTAAESTHYFDPALVILYKYLRSECKKLRVDSMVDIPLDVECSFLYRSAQCYERLGLPALALEIISISPLYLGRALPEGNSTVDLNANETDVKEAKSLEDPAASDSIDWSKPVAQQAPEEFDWSKPVSSTATDFDWGAPVSSQSASS